VDNQQVRLQELIRLNKKMIVARAWLAGTIDADGCIFFMSRKRRGRWLVHEPAVDIASICPATLNCVARTMDKLGSACFITSPNQKVRATRTSGIRRCKALLSQLVPFMVTKQIEAQLMLMWCDSRLKRAGQPYSEEEDNLMQAVKKMKSWRNLRDYTPTPWWLDNDDQGEDIVRSPGEILGKQVEIACSSIQ